MTAPSEASPFEIRPLKIGALTLSFPFLLAPLSGYTHLPFRLICRRFHCGLTFTEMVTAEGITRHHRRTWNFLETRERERPVAAHIYGSRPESLAEAARILTAAGGFDLVDLNCGCAVRKIARKGAGMALTHDPEQLKDIVRMITRATSLPVTVKTRLGFSPRLSNISAVAQAAEEGGAAALFLHGRFASDLHRGPADWKTIQKIKEERSIPVIGNGGIIRAEEAISRFRETGVDGVMIGRAALGRPWIFQEIYCLINGLPFHPPAPEEIREIIGWHLEELFQQVLRNDQRGGAEAFACRQFLSHLNKYLNGYPGWKKWRRRSAELNSRKKLLHAVDRVLFKN